MGAGTCYVNRKSNDARDRKSKSANLSAGEGDLLSILADDERASVVLIVQHSSELDDLQIFVARVLHGGNDPQIGYGWDIVGGSRDRDLKTTGGASGGFGVSTDGCKTKRNKR